MQVATSSEQCATKAQQELHAKGPACISQLVRITMLLLPRWPACQKGLALLYAGSHKETLQETSEFQTACLQTAHDRNSVPDCMGVTFGHAGNLQGSQRQGSRNFRRIVLDSSVPLK